MVSALATPMAFGVLMALFGLGLVGAVTGRKHDGFANIWGNLWAAVGSIWGLVFASSVIVSGHEVVFSHAVSSFPFLNFAFHVDKLSAFFVFTICLIVLFCSTYGIGYVREFYKRYNIGNLGLFYNLFIAAMLLVVTAANGIFFLLVWEIMSLASYFLVVYDRHKHENVKAGYLYLIMTHIGTAFILLSFLLLYGYTGSFDFEVIKAHMPMVPSLVKDAVFGLAFIGFGTKAGVIPMHIWLPSAHPSAPSHVSALMSGVMIKTGIYMMIRLFVDVLSPAPSWWGVALLVMGSISCVLGVLYALTEHDIKRLLAYHSIENIGIILLGLGGSLVFSAGHQPALALLALGAALFHTLNHAIFKSLLFLSAGSVIQATHTRNIEKFGGLIKFMPLTALFFLIGSMAISALPPFNGFFSEWLTFQSLFQGVAAGDLYVKWAFVAATGALALTGGLALACFVKAFGTVFLARPRSEMVQGVHESSGWMRFGMGGLAALCLIVGVFASFAATTLQDVGRSLSGLSQVALASSVSTSQTLTLSHGYASVSPPAIILGVLVVPFAVWLLVRYGIYRKQKVRIDSTWDCGFEFTDRMEITSTGFARSIIMIFKGLLRPKVQHMVEYDDLASRYAPSSRTVLLTIGEVYRKYTYDPLYDLAVRFSKRVKRIQNGNINAYVLYIFAILVITLLVGV